MSSRSEAVEKLRCEFRDHLQRFYGALHLAPPYDTVEKAVSSLTASIIAMDSHGQALVLGDPSVRWREFQKAFMAAGLHQKHRGIIIGLIQTKRTTALEPEYAAFLDTFQRS